MLIRFWRDARGATAIEYCLVAGLISMVVFGAVAAIGKTMSVNYYGKLASAFN